MWAGHVYIISFKNWFHFCAFVLSTVGVYHIFRKFSVAQWAGTRIYKNPKIEVLTYQGLTIDFCIKETIKFIIRGVRDCIDFEYETKMSFMNEDLNDTITTFLIPCSKEFSGVSSTLIKSLIQNNGNYSKFIPLEIKNEPLS